MTFCDWLIVADAAGAAVFFAGIVWRVRSRGPT
jgi:hypothetical protein